MQAKVGQFRRPFRDNGKELPRAQQDCLIATVHAATGADASASVYIVKNWDIAILRLHKIELIYTQKLYIPLIKYKKQYALMSGITYTGRKTNETVDCGG